VNCRPEHVTAWVDGELDAVERAQIEEHVAACAVCAEQAESERRLREGLRRLPQPEPPAGLEFVVRRGLRQDRRARVLRVALPLAASLLVAFLWARATPSVLALQVARDHGHCYALERLPAEVFADDIEPVAAWFRGRGRELPPLPSSAAGLALVGGRFCPLIDRKVAHLYYRDAQRRVSLFVIPDPVRLDRRHEAHFLGHAVRLRRLAGQTLAIVADREADAEAFERGFDTLRADLR
jgi:anti-sigma factor RsiW